MCDLPCLVALVCLLSALAFLLIPQYFASDIKSKKITVDGTYWGPYHGNKPEGQSGSHTIEIQRVFSGHKAIAGSETYASGKGTSG